ncbi:DUF5994 family protein [Streptomyces sp. NPDC058291]|uniref:DUF5994 family protein n=1 Tax=Streptomyces sp. NPDC058291 TaxID=3346427 RepID=UPI0036E848E2
MTTAPQPPPPLLRLSLAPRGAAPRPVDGAWWPRSYDLLAELPHLLGGLPPEWGQVTSVIVNGSTWSATPGRTLVCNQVVRLRRTEAASAPNTVVLFAAGQGRRDLLIVPPESTEQAARPFMAAAADGRL